MLPVKKRKHLNIRGMVAYLLILAAILVLVIFAVNTFSHSSQEESQRILEQAISNSLVTCYAIEGSYPASISYLEENYGLSIDHSKYEVDYRMFAANIMPDFTLIRK